MKAKIRVLKKAKKQKTKEIKESRHFKLKYNNEWFENRYKDIF